jgi:hypothetical protein
VGCSRISLDSVHRRESSSSCTRWTPGDQGNQVCRRSNLFNGLFPPRLAESNKSVDQIGGQLIPNLGSMFLYMIGQNGSATFYQSECVLTLSRPIIRPPTTPWRPHLTSSSSSSSMDPRPESLDHRCGPLTMDPELRKENYGCLVMTI